MLICGIDEAGRGPLAGPVVAAAVVFQNDFMIDEVKDSKILSPFERESLFFRIIDKCSCYSISIADNNLIDSINILKATMYAMHECIKKLSLIPEIYLIDGNYFKLNDEEHLKLNHKTVIKGDSKIFQISCASILAKVTRDNIMKGYHLRFPQYNFDRHKGYATAEHYKMINKYGLCEIHRKSFLKNYISNGEIIDYELHI